MYQLPERLKNLVPYEPLKGSYSIRADANESFLSLPDDLREQIAQAVSEIRFNRYPDSTCKQLRESFAELYGLNASRIVAGNGSDELIGLIISSFTAPGDAMAVVSPEFSMYAFYAQMCGVKVETFSKKENELTLDVDAFIQFAKEKQVSLVILSNPCNPTSLVSSREDMKKIVDSLDCLVVIDEAYMEFSTGSVLDVADSRDNLIVLKTCSKAFGMAAIRLGFAVSNETITTALRSVKSPYNVNSMTQTAGCVLFQQKDYLNNCIEQIKQSRDELYSMIDALKDKKTDLQNVVNTQANFVFVKVKEPQNVNQSMRKRGIALRCLGEYLRISASSPQENQAIVTALSEILS